MGLAKRVIAALLLTGAAALLLASSVLAQERVGVVTNIEGTATVARLTLPQAQPLHFKDDVFLRDRIATGERSFVRVLLGGKATVTARERSVLTITEVPGVSTIQLGEGRISVAVSKGLMKPAEVVPTPEGHRSTITILKGLVDVTKLDSAGRLSGSAVKLGALERVTVTNSPAVPRPETITQEAAKKLASDFSHIPKNAPAATLDALNADVKENSIREATQTLGGNGSDTRPSVNTAGATGTTSSGTTTTSSPIGSTTTTSGGTTGAVGAVTGSVTNTVTTVTGGVASTLTSVTGAATGTLTNLTGSTTQTVVPTVTNPVTNLVTTVTSTTTTVTSTVTNSLLNGLLKK